MSEADLAMHGHSPAGVMAEPAFSVPSKKTAMWLFIIADSATFAACLVAYGFLRNSTPNWPTPFKFYPSIIFSSVMTLVLLSSSLTMVMAVSASARRNKSGARKWIIATAVLGATFIVLHMIEWKHLIDEGLRPFQLPAEWVEKWPGATPLFGATFFGITGMHMFHVFTGCIYLLVVAGRVKKLKHEDVEISGLYWHFVDLVWMFVFPMIYLLSVYPKK